MRKKLLITGDVDIYNTPCLYYKKVACITEEDNIKKFYSNDVVIVCGIKTVYSLCKKHPAFKITWRGIKRRPLIIYTTTNPVLQHATCASKIKKLDARSCGGLVVWEFILNNLKKN